MNREPEEGRQEGNAAAQPPRDGSPVGASGWVREDFVAALPLYVGGDLDRAEATRVDAWLAAHPEDRETLAASEAAAGVLARHASVQHRRPTPDLWSGIRSELVGAGMIEGASSPGASSGETPILGGPRWFQRKSVAAAAALMLTCSVGLMLTSRGVGPAAEPNPAAGPSAGPSADPSADPSSGIEAPFTPEVHLVQTSPAARSGGSPGLQLVAAEGQGLPSGLSGTAARPLDVRAVSMPVSSARRSGGVAVPTTRSGQVQRLRRVQPGEGRLIDEAPPVLLWQVAPWVETEMQALRRGDSGAQLTSGGR